MKTLNTRAQKNSRNEANVGFNEVVNHWLTMRIILILSSCCFLENLAKLYLGATPWHTENSDSIQLTFSLLPISWPYVPVTSSGTGLLVIKRLKTKSCLYYREVPGSEEGEEELGCREEVVVVAGDGTTTSPGSTTCEAGGTAVRTTVRTSPTLTPTSTGISALTISVIVEPQFNRYSIGWSSCLI